MYSENSSYESYEASYSEKFYSNNLNNNIDEESLSSDFSLLGGQNENENNKNENRNDQHRNDRNRNDQHRNDRNRNDQHRNDQHRNDRNRNDRNRNDQHRNDRNRNDRNRNDQHRNDQQQIPQQNPRDLITQWKNKQIQQTDTYTQEQINDLIKEGSKVIVSGEQNNILDQLSELYKIGKDLPKNIIKQLQEYNPYLFEIYNECDNKECVITQIYPRLLEHKFKQIEKIQQLLQSPFKIILFNTLYNIRQGKYFQQNLDVPDKLPVPDENIDMFVECQSQEWITKTLNQNKKQIKIGLYYDDEHILMCEDIIDEYRITQLTKPNVIFNENVLQYTRYLEKLDKIYINFNINKGLVYTFQQYVDIYNIKEDMRQALQQQSEKQHVLTLVSTVGEALRFQDEMEVLKKKRIEELKQKRIEELKQKSTEELK